MSTGLTPSISRISLAQVDVPTLHALTLRMLESNHHNSALQFAQQLYRLSKAVAHGILYAKCFFLTDEKRRCLGILEQMGFLGAEAIQAVREMSPGYIDYLSAILLAAQCLHDLEQYDDCIALIDPVVGNEKFKAGQIFASGGTNTFASLYLVLGRCYDSVDNRAKAIRFLTKSVQTDPYLVEAVEYLLTRSLLSPKEKLSLLQELEVEMQTEHWLIDHYRFLFHMKGDLY